MIEKLEQQICPQLKNELQLGPPDAGVNKLGETIVIASSKGQSRRIVWKDPPEKAAQVHRTIGEYG